MIIERERVHPTQHPNAAQLKPESVAALAEAKANEGEWVVWQSGFAHGRASKVQAHNLRSGKRQKTLTAGLLEDDGDELLEFKAWKNTESGDYCVIARYTTAVYRIEERERTSAEAS